MTGTVENAVFHDGERALQERTGARAQASRNGAMIAAEIAEPARAFLAAQRMLVIGSRGGDGFPWVSLIFGEPGFVAVPRHDLVEIRLDRSYPPLDEATREGLQPDAEIGLLAIDLDRRRRFRVNGRVERVDAASLLIRVRQAYPNCPKYIRRRRLTAVEPESSRGAAHRSGASLDAAARGSVEASDIFFMASAHPTGGADLSHRGGPIGFVRVVDDRTLLLPDYPGNGMFNSLGNLVVEPRVGLAFVDFARGRLLRIAGRAELRFDEEPPGQPTGGTRRVLQVSIESWREDPLGVAARWEELESSPFNPRATEPGSLE